MEIGSPVPTAEYAPGIDRPPHGALTVPGGARRARAGLSPAARAKLTRLETDEQAAHALLVATSNRVRGAHDERGRLARQLDALRATPPTRLLGSWRKDPDRGPTARTWVPAVDGNPDAIVQQLGEATDELARLTRVRDAVEARWTALRQLVDACRSFLNVPPV